MAATDPTAQGGAFYGPSGFAHLAGALGVPVGVLSRYDACWRWLAGRDDSPWYPTMRLFRQERPGDWESVVARVAVELSQLAHNKAA